MFHDAAKCNIFYYGKFGIFTKDCMKRKFNESKYRNRRHTSYFSNRKETINNDLQNLKLFILYATLLVETNYSNAWFIGYGGGSIHMSLQ